LRGSAAARRVRTLNRPYQAAHQTILRIARNHADAADLTRLQC
jgi:hypothetical protein